MTVERQSPPASIFISYSTQDTNVARVIRNAFEALGHEALLFYLKQEMSDDDLHNLLRKEVQARSWFVALDSSAAQESKFVQIEHAWAKFYDKPVYKIGIDCAKGLNEAELLKTCFEPFIEPQITEVSKGIQLFISYSRHDNDWARRITDTLKSDGFEVFFDQFNLQSGSASWAKQLEEAIINSSRYGAIILLVSSSSLQSAWVLREVELAVQQGGRLIPCLIEDRAFVDDLPDFVKRLQMIDFTHDFARGYLQLRQALFAFGSNR